MHVHELKSWPEFFDAIWSGRKSFELRQDDRNFVVGDILRLREFDPDDQVYTGREVVLPITYILRDAPQFGLMAGYAILSLDQPLREVDRDDWA